MKFATLATVAVVLSGAEAIRLHEKVEVESQLTLTQQAQIEQMEKSLSQLSSRMEENQQQLAQMQSWWNKAFNTVKSWF